MSLININRPRSSFPLSTVLLEILLRCLGLWESTVAKGTKAQHKVCKFDDNSSRSQVRGPVRVFKKKFYFVVDIKNSFIHKNVCITANLPAFYS